MIAQNYVFNIFNFSHKNLESRGEFSEKLQRARSQVKPNTTSQPILSKPGPTRLVVGNWALSSRKDGELHIHNSDGQQVHIINSQLL
jgi:E3 ubiquitin-protein ligase HECTD1